MVYPCNARTLYLAAPTFSCRCYANMFRDACIPLPGKHVCFKIAPVPHSQQSRAWDCSLAMVKYLETLQLEGLRVLELGCGLGLPSIASALLGAYSVHVTDRDILAAKETILLNPSVKGIVKARVLRWGSGDGLRMPDLPYDLVLGTDILYTGDKSSTTALMKTICDVCSFGTKLIIMNERRWGGDNSQLFLSCLRQAKFHVEEDVPIDEGSAIVDDIGPEEGQMSLVIAHRIRWSEGG